LRLHIFHSILVSTSTAGQTGTDENERSNLEGNPKRGRQYLPLEPGGWCQLGRLKLKPSMVVRAALKVDGHVLLSSTEHVKILTTAELKEALASAVGI